MFEKSKSNNVTIDDITKVDKYKIYESKAPEGYKNNSGIIELEVTKTIKNNGNSSVYQISNVRVRAGSWAKDLKPNSGNKVQITLGLESIDTDVATPGYVIGVEISANAITVTYKNNKEEKDVNVAINKRSTYNTEVDDVTLDRDRKSINIYQLKRLTALSVACCMDNFSFVDEVIDGKGRDGEYIKDKQIEFDDEFKEKYAKHLMERFDIKEDDGDGTNCVL